MKKILVSMAMMMALVSTASQAAWYTVTVVNVGANSTTINLKVTDSGGAFSNLWVQATGSTSKEIIATGLTAKALGSSMLIQLDTITPFSELKGAYLAD